MDGTTELTNITRVYAGERDAMALRYDGSVYGWGYYGVGQFSNNIVHPIFMGESPAKIFAFQHGVKTEGTDVVEYDNIPNYIYINNDCLLYTSPSPRDRQKSRMPSSA